MKSMSRRLLVAVPSAAVGALALTLVAGAVAHAVPLTPHQTPFPCGQTWTGSTRGSHTPSTRSIDFNRAGDEGDAVVASASGIVAKADSVSTRSYGHHVVIDHGNGESSIYAHLDKVLVTTGQYVDQGAMLGTVGNTGNSRGAHLHFEQRAGKQVVAAAFGGVPFAYGSTVSTNCVDVPIAGDFTGDGAAEVAVFRRAPQSTFVLNHPAGAQVVRFGSATDEPLIGDWDGNGVADLGLRRPKASKFLLRGAAGVVKVRYGVRSDRALVGDWDGNGIDEVGVHRPSTATFHQRLADGSTVAVPLGTPTTCRSRATGTATVRPTSASSTRRAPCSPCGPPMPAGWPGPSRSSSAPRATSPSSATGTATGSATSGCGRRRLLSSRRDARSVPSPRLRRPPAWRSPPSSSGSPGAERRLRQASRDRAGGARRPWGWSARTCVHHRPGGGRRPPSRAGRPAS
ncbi:peptidoglycan DD-metalloendopeptidase family protein [Nocardioides piscis]|uniref:Peptidoglycan DD-metalloendopeptidase family protein n=1 Tax=Nocardioides piscis TaxID=2714938 RepID=A0A6G7YHS6_9ACTN|nr:peptidoglycan DD-metalloendopeptidase family protein [Nocardioides piscis]